MASKRTKVVKPVAPKGTKVVQPALTQDLYSTLTQDYRALTQDYDAYNAKIYGGTTYENIDNYMKSMNNTGPVNGLAAKLAGPMATEVVKPVVPMATEVVKPVVPMATEVVKPTAGNFLGVDGTKKLFGGINKLDDANSEQKDYMAQTATVGTEYTNDPEIQSALLQGYNALATPKVDDSFLGMSGNTIKNVGGVVDIVGGLYGAYSKYQQNKRADDMMDMYKQDRGIAQQKERDFADAVSTRGLGTYVTGIKS